MLNYNQDKRIERLIEDGNQFRKKLKKQENPIFSIRIWLAAISDTLKPKLENSSALLEEFKKVQQLIDKDEKLTNEELEEIISNAIDFLEYIRKLPISNNTSSEIYKAEQIRLEREIRYFISEYFFKSWWFRIPIAILVVAIIFAITGTIQIQGYAISVQDITDKAIERTKQDIQAQAEGIISDLQIYSTDEEKRIKEEVDNHIETLKLQKAPDIEEELSGIKGGINTLYLSLDPLESKISHLENRLLPLEQAIDIIDQGAERGLLDDASFILKSFTIVIWVVIGLSLLAFIFSLIALWKVGKRQ